MVTMNSADAAEQLTVTPSLSSPGNWWNNAVAEAFSYNLKKERIQKYIYKNHQLAIAGVLD